MVALKSHSPVLLRYVNKQNENVITKQNIPFACRLMTAIPPVPNLMEHKTDFRNQKRDIRILLSLFISYFN